MRTSQIRLCLGLQDHYAAACNLALLVWATSVRMEQGLHAMKEVPSSGGVHADQIVPATSSDVPSKTDSTSKFFAFFFLNLSGDGRGGGGGRRGFRAMLTYHFLRVHGSRQEHAQRLGPPAVSGCTNPKHALRMNGSIIEGWICTIVHGLQANLHQQPISTQTSQYPHCNTCHIHSAPTQCMDADAGGVGQRESSKVEPDNFNQ